MFKKIFGSLFADPTLPTPPHLKRVDNKTEMEQFFLITEAWSTDFLRYLPDLSNSEFNARANKFIKQQIDDNKVLTAPSKKVVHDRLIKYFNLDYIRSEKTGW